MGVKHIFTTQRTLCFAICALRQHRSWRQHKDLSYVITKPGKSVQCTIHEKLCNLRYMFCASVLGTGWCWNKFGWRWLRHVGRIQSRPPLLYWVTTSSQYRKQSPSLASVESLETGAGDPWSYLLEQTLSGRSFLSAPSRWFSYMPRPRYRLYALGFDLKLYRLFDQS